MARNESSNRLAPYRDNGASPINLPVSFGARPEQFNATINPNTGNKSAFRSVVEGLNGVVSGFSNAANSILQGQEIEDQKQQKLSYFGAKYAEESVIPYWTAFYKQNPEQNPMLADPSIFESPEGITASGQAVIDQITKETFADQKVDPKVIEGFQDRLKTQFLPNLFNTAISEISRQQKIAAEESASSLEMAIVDGKDYTNQSEAFVKSLVINGLPESRANQIRDELINESIKKRNTLNFQKNVDSLLDMYASGAISAGSIAERLTTLANESEGQTGLFYHEKARQFKAIAENEANDLETTKALASVWSLKGLDELSSFRDTLVTQLGEITDPEQYKKLSTMFTLTEQRINDLQALDSEQSRKEAETLQLDFINQAKTVFGAIGQENFASVKEEYDAYYEKISQLVKTPEQFEQMIRLRQLTETLLTDGVKEKANVYIDEIRLNPSSENISKATMFVNNLPKGTGIYASSLIEMLGKMEKGEKITGLKETLNTIIDNTQVPAATKSFQIQQVLTSKHFENNIDEAADWLTNTLNGSINPETNGAILVAMNNIRNSPNNIITTKVLSELVNKGGNGLAMASALTFVLNDPQSLDDLNNGKFDGVSALLLDARGSFGDDNIDLTNDDAKKARKNLNDKFMDSLEQYIEDSFSNAPGVRGYWSPTWFKEGIAPRDLTMLQSLYKSAYYFNRNQGVEESQAHKLAAASFSKIARENFALQTKQAKGGNSWFTNAFFPFGEYPRMTYNPSGWKDTGVPDPIMGEKWTARPFSNPRTGTPSPTIENDAIRMGMYQRLTDLKEARKAANEAGNDKEAQRLDAMINKIKDIDIERFILNTNRTAIADKRLAERNASKTEYAYILTDPTTGIDISIPVYAPDILKSVTGTSARQYNAHLFMVWARKQTIKDDFFVKDMTYDAALEMFKKDIESSGGIDNWLKINNVDPNAWDLERTKDIRETERELFIKAGGF